MVEYCYVITFLRSGSIGRVEEAHKAETEGEKESQKERQETNVCTILLS